MNQRRCAYCGHDFGQPVPIAICDPCDKRVAEEKRLEKANAGKRAMASRMARWAGRAGKFATAAPTKLPFENQRTLLEAWDPGGRHGVTLTGDGQGKSWLLWLLIKKAWAGGLSFEARLATEMRGEIMALARNGDTTPAIRRLAQVSILVIDDFGLASATPAADELWVKLLEMRARAGKPTLIASPYCGGNMVDRFSDRTAGQKIVKMLGIGHNWVHDTRTDQLHRPLS